MNTIPYRFEVGETYWTNSCYHSNYKVVKRTNCFVWLELNPSAGGPYNTVQKKIRIDCEGNEYVSFSRKDNNYFEAAFVVWSYHKWMNGQKAKLEIA